MAHPSSPSSLASHRASGRTRWTTLTVEPLLPGHAQHARLCHALQDCVQQVCVQLMLPRLAFCIGPNQHGCLAACRSPPSVSILRAGGSSLYTTACLEVEPVAAHEFFDCIGPHHYNVAWHRADMQHPSCCVQRTMMMIRCRGCIRRPQQPPARQRLSLCSPARSRTRLGPEALAWTPPPTRAPPMFRPRVGPYLDT